MTVSFEQVFDVQTKQDEVFDVVARPVIDKLATLSLCSALDINASNALMLLVGHPVYKNIIPD